MEEEVAREVKEEKRAKTRVSMAMNEQRGTSRAVMLVPAAAPEVKDDVLSTGIRRSSRPQPVVSMDADTVMRLTKKAVRESKANAATTESTKPKKTKKTRAKRPNVNANVNTKPAPKKQKK